VAPLPQSLSLVEVVEEMAVPPVFMRAVLRLPMSLVPDHLRGLIQHLDVDRPGILELVKRTGEEPEGISIRTGEKQLQTR
jgi:hypothetical protein